MIPMLRNLVERTYSEGKVYVEIAGLSTDTKPDMIHGRDIVTGSLFLEVDTMTLFAYDEVNQTWGNGASLGGGA